MSDSVRRIMLLVSLLLMLLLLFGCSSEFQKDQANDAYGQGYDAGYRNGYEAGLASADGGSTSSSVGAYYAIENMDFDDVIAYVEDSDYYKVMPQEDLSALFAYALQRGYIAGKTGTWDSTMEEYVNGCDVRDSAVEFEKIYGVSSFRIKAGSVYLNMYANRKPGEEPSKVFDEWQKWTETEFHS